MVQWLTYIGLAVSPFMLIQGYDTRYPKEMFCLLVACAIALCGLTKGLQKLENKPMVSLVFVMAALNLFVPPSGLALAMPVNNTLIITGSDVDTLWNYRPMFVALVYLLMVMTIAGDEIKIEHVFSIISWTGFLSASLIILQKLNINQFLHVRPISEIGTPINPELTAFLGQPTLAAAFLALCFLASFRVKKYWMSIVIVVSVWLTGSRLAVAALILSLSLLPFIHFNKKALLSLPAAVFLCFVGLFYFLKLPDDGRFGLWQQILYDMRHPISGGDNQYGLTGYGAGAFHYYFPLLHHRLAYEAHNEPLEFLFNTGIIGFAFFITAVFTFLKSCFYESDKEIRWLMSIFLVSCFLSLGTFFWQLSVGGFYTAIIVALSYNILRRKNVQATA